MRTRLQNRLSGRLLTVGVLLLAGLAPACVSTSDIESIQSQLNDIQNQIDQAQAQAPSKEEVTSLEAQVSRQMEAVLKSEADMQVRLQDLSDEIEQLQANLEDTNYRLSQLSQQIASTNQELKAFRAAPPVIPSSEGGEDDPSLGTTVPPASGTVTTDPQSLYQAAYNDYLRGNYDLAVQSFEEYLRAFPGTDLADNAVYWIGECFYRQGQFRQAIGQFDAVVARYPRSDKLPSAVLKKGYAHLQLGERGEGVDQLRRVVDRYPNSDEANLARQRLREVGVESR
ncbi:MAG: tol-pal system protein YbgF [Acidobacteriota bacterium]